MAPKYLDVHVIKFDFTLTRIHADRYGNLKEIHGMHIYVIMI